MGVICRKPKHKAGYQWPFLTAGMWTQRAYPFLQGDPRAGDTTFTNKAKLNAGYDFTADNNIQVLVLPIRVQMMAASVNTNNVSLYLLDASDNILFRLLGDYRTGFSNTKPKLDDVVDAGAHCSDFSYVLKVSSKTTFQIMRGDGVTVVKEKALVAPVRKIAIAASDNNNVLARIDIDANTAFLMC
jgi:hypothetical protein